MEIQKTINYFQFKRVESNRPVDQRDVNKLIEKIKVKNLLHLFPILVNSKMEVIDGQHRLAAAEALREYVYYRVDDQISKSDIANINSVAKNWKVIDYINYYQVEKAPGFDVLCQFLIENPLIPSSTALRMLGAPNAANSTGKLREGTIDVSNIEEANRIAGILRDFHDVISWAYERHIVLAIINMARTAGYDHTVMMGKLEYQSRSLVKCISVKQYSEMLEEIYNYKSSKNLLKIAC